MKLIGILALLLAFGACNNNGAPPAANSGSVHAGAQDTIITGAKPLVLEGCYEMIIEHDTATLQLNVRDTVVTGSLVYDWHEKDRNRGRLQGVVRHGRILADYTFESEGLTSVREVAFRIQDSTLLPGNGELSEQNGKVVFTNPDQLHYDSVHPFLKIPCPNAHP